MKKIFIFLFALFNVAGIYCQSLPPCATSSTGYGEFEKREWTAKTNIFRPLNPHRSVEIGRVSGYVRQGKAYDPNNPDYGPSVFEVYIDWNTMQKANAVLDDETVKQFLIYHICQSVAGKPENQLIVHIKFIYEVPCEAEVKVILQVEEDATGICCDLPTDTPNNFTYNNKNAITKTVIKQCGFKCCAIDYTAEPYYDTIKERWSYKVGKLGSPYELTSCGMSPYTDCQTGIPIPCIGNCVKP